MITVVIKDDGEPNVIALTYENLWKELKDIEGSELLVSEDWFAPLYKTKNNYICLVEADCLVSSGYFASQAGLFKKNPYFRKLAMLSSAVGVNHWGNRFYGYNFRNDVDECVTPNREKKSNQVYPIQVGYVPGSIIRVKMLKEALDTIGKIDGWEKDLVFLSATISAEFWRQADGNRIHINPNTTYVTTEQYVNDLGIFNFEASDLSEMFHRETIT